MYYLISNWLSFTTVIVSKLGLAIYHFRKIRIKRMHSSRMRTGRSLTVCWRLLPGGGLLWWGVVWGGGAWSRGVCSRGVVSGPGGVWSGGVPGLGWWCLIWGGGAWSGGVSQHALRQTPHPLWTESQMPVKTLPWSNFVAAGKNEMTLRHYALLVHVGNCTTRFKTWMPRAHIVCRTLQINCLTKIAMNQPINPVYF